MFVLATSAADVGASLTGRARRARRAEGDSSPPGRAVALHRPLYVTGTGAGKAIHGRALAVAADRTGTRYLVEDRDGERHWVAEAAIGRLTPFAPGDAVIGYVAVRGTPPPGATRGPVARLRQAVEHCGWRLAGIECDHGLGSVADRPGLRRALERIRAREAAGLVVLELDRAAGSDAAAGELLAAVRDAGGSVVALGADDLPHRGGGRRASSAARATALRRISELRADGMAPQAIADALNAEGVATLGADPLWHAWSVRAVGGAWPPRIPERRRPPPRA